MVDPLPNIDGRLWQTILKGCGYISSAPSAQQVPLQGASSPGPPFVTANTNMSIASGSERPEAQASKEKGGDGTLKCEDGHAVLLIASRADWKATLNSAKATHAHAHMKETPWKSIYDSQVDAWSYEDPDGGIFPFSKAQVRRASPRLVNLFDDIFGYKQSSRVLVVPSLDAQHTIQVQSHEGIPSRCNAMLHAGMPELSHHVTRNAHVQSHQGLMPHSVQAIACHFLTGGYGRLSPCILH